MCSFRRVGLSQSFKDCGNTQRVYKRTVSETPRSRCRDNAPTDSWQQNNNKYVIINISLLTVASYDIIAMNHDLLLVKVYTLQLVMCVLTLSWPQRPRQPQSLGEPLRLDQPQSASGPVPPISPQSRSHFKTVQL